MAGWLTRTGALANKHPGPSGSASALLWTGSKAADHHLNGTMNCLFGAELLNSRPGQCRSWFVSVVVGDLLLEAATRTVPVSVTVTVWSLQVGEVCTGVHYKRGTGSLKDSWLARGLKMPNTHTERSPEESEMYPI